VSKQLEHGMNCGARSIAFGDNDCTCCLAERIATQTAETLLAAWQKRANEAEAELTAERARVAWLREAIERIRVLAANASLLTVDGTAQDFLEIVRDALGDK